MDKRHKDELRARVARRLGLVGPAKVEVVTLPVMRARLEPVSSARKEELAASIDEGFYARKERRKPEKTKTPLDDSSVAAVCKTCGGACCKAGENHAFLTRAVLSRVKAEKRVGNERLLRSYLDHVPERAYAGSCIYHAADGCALPREMRSETCNRYLCEPMTRLGQTFAMPGYAQVAISHKESETNMLLLSGRDVDELSDPEWSAGADELDA